MATPLRTNGLKAPGVDASVISSSASGFTGRAVAAPRRAVVVSKAAKNGVISMAKGKGAEKMTKQAKVAKAAQLKSESTTASVQAAPPIAAASLSTPGAGLMVGVAVAAAAAGAAVRDIMTKPQPAADALPTPFGQPSKERMANDTAEVAKNLGYHAKYSAASRPRAFEPPQAYKAVANSVEERLVERWDDTYEHLEKEDPKMAYYLSMEYLQGRTLANAVRNIGMKDSYSEALTQFGHDLEAVEMLEKDAGLGNGGLGRLAACFLDSMATLDLPAWGYGLRYKYGLFKQGLTKDGQYEMAEDWLDQGNPWEVRRDDVAYSVGFYGSVVGGKWVPGEEAVAVAHDSPIPGYNTRNTISLRLWSTDGPSTKFGLEAFNEGKHMDAAKDQVRSTEICAVLYPGDETLEGKELRLRQQYLLCSASTQDIMTRFKERQMAKGNRINWKLFPTKVALQMNDTHPTLAAPELMRLLIDQEGLKWDDAWAITTKTVNYTNHTILPEALEKWPVTLMDKLLPRHMEIIRRIDAEFVKSISKPLAGEDAEATTARIEDMRVIINDPESLATGEEPKGPGLVKMANLCVIAGAAVNGVAALHSEIVKDDVFNNFYKLWPHKFQNKTNGVTPRRWLAWCNPSLANVITKWLGTDAWVKDLDLLKGLEKFADDPALHAEWTASKLENKKEVQAWVKERTGISIPLDSMYDTQVKRIHEYKRQLLNILAVVYRYKQIKAMTPAERKEVVPKVVMIGGKAFATYVQAKRIVQLIVKVGETVNNDPEIGDLLKVVFLPNYNVTVAEKIIPGTELCQQISTAGMEASGTSNMKFMMNGSLTVGTLDGANVEIRECAGEEHFFLFGAVTEEVVPIREARAAGKFVPDARFLETMDYILAGTFGETDFKPLLDSLSPEFNEGFGLGDYFIVGHDFPSYIDALAEADEHYKDQTKWVKSSIINTANSGKFSSDRTIAQYASEIWGIEPCRVPDN